MRDGIRPVETAVLLVDPLNDLVSEGGKLWPYLRGVAEGNGMLRNMLLVTRAARRRAIRIFHVPHHRAGSDDLAQWRHPGPDQVRLAEIHAFAKGEWGGDWHPDFVPQEDDVVVQDHWGHDGFASTDLDLQLRQHRIRHVILIGPRAGTCVEATGRHAMELGYDVTLVTDATAAVSETHMRAAHELNGPTFARSILSTAELLVALQACSP